MNKIVAIGHRQANHGRMVTAAVRRLCPNDAEVLPQGAGCRS